MCLEWRTICNRFATVVCVIIVVAMINPVSASDLEWIGGGGDKLWSNPDNWSAGRVPKDDFVIINAPNAAGSKGPEIDEGTRAKAHVLISDFGSATMKMSGGSLELTGWGAWWGDSIDGTATFEMSGGEVNFTGSPGVLQLGWQAENAPPRSSRGVWEMTGGEVNVKGIDMPGGDWGGGAEIVLEGGTMTVGTARVGSENGLVMYRGVEN